MAEVEKRAPRGQFRVIAKPLFGVDYWLKDWPSFVGAANHADEMHAGPNFNEFFVYNDEGVMVYDPTKKE